METNAQDKLKEKEEVTPLVSKRKVAYGCVDIGGRAWDLLKGALDSTRVSTGPLVAEFEKRFAEAVGAKMAVAVSSGTDACLVMMASILDRGGQRGDGVIVPACTFSSTANAVLMAGLVPKFVDIDINTLNLDVNKIEEAVDAKTKAIFPVHLMGKPVDMDTVFDIAERRGLLVYEDACEAHGAEYKGKRVGSFSDGAAFSLYAAHLICTGEGGMVTTQSNEMADLYRSLRSHGRPAGKLVFDFQRIGFNSKMNELEAALGVAIVDKYEQIREERKKNLDFYISAVKLMPRAIEWIWVPTQEEHELLGPQGFPMVVRPGAPFSRDDLAVAFNEAGIEWKLMFGSLPTQHPAYKFLGYKEGDFPAAEYIGKAGLHIGIHHHLTDDDRFHVIATLLRFMEKY
jgi:dTDP-4-amino-4,6-dideoxygalactose transaminase